ncbi:transglutaminaseTgpA domain-containing protein [Georgenia sp. Marseille-Q6866]
MNDPWVAALLRGRWVESALAVTALVAVSWPLGELVSTRPWIGPLFGILLLVVVVGSLVRMARVPPWLVLLAQVLALLGGLAGWAQQHRPADESALVAMSALVREGVLTIQTFSVPAPATPGLTFVVLGSIAALALVVEALGVTFRAGALAGIPLLLVSAGAASGSGQALDPRYFLVGAAAWLVLLSQQGRARLEEWEDRPDAAVSVDRVAAVRGNHHRLGVTARVMGLSALLLAVVLPGMLPHLPPTVLVDGRSGEGAPGTVSFTDTLDLSQDLADRSNAPVIRFRTDDSSPPPLRVTASLTYADGQWLPVGDATSGPYRMPALNPMSALGYPESGIESTLRTMTVTQNGMRAPQLAMPYPPSEVDLGEVEWTWDSLTEAMHVDAAPGTYEVQYREMGGLETLPAEIGAPPEPVADRYPPDDLVDEVLEDGTIFTMSPDGMTVATMYPDGRYESYLSDGTAVVEHPDGTVERMFGYGGPNTLEVDPASRTVVEELAAEVTGDRTNQIDVALEIQRYLRSPEFTYSLTLADPVEGADGQPLDPISHFLATKQGYCTQFATAMVMLARAQDIPARLAIGFLPGSRGLDGTRTVVASDAHAWPELFITGLGWTRFEPTPGQRSGTAPTFATEGQQQEAPAPQEVPSTEEPTVAPALPDSAGGAGGSGEEGWFERHAEVIGWTALGLAAVLALASVVPLAGRWQRWRSRRGRSPAEQVEGEWSVLVESLADLGVAPPAAATPRALRDHYAREIAPDVPTREALGRATDRLESARYAGQAPELGTMREDVRQVVEWQRARVTRRRRLLATLLPAGGRAQLGSLLPGRRPHPAVD